MFIPNRMKVGFNGLRGKEISLISIVLMSATIIFWSWEKMPGLNTFLPPETPALQFSSDHLVTTRSVEVPSPDTRLGEDGSLLAKTKTTNEFKEELDQEGVSETIPSQISSGKSNDEDGPPLLPKEKTANEPENLHLEGASQKIPAQTTYEGEDGSSLTKEKTVNEGEKLHLEGASQMVPVQTSSGKNMSEDGPSLAKEKTTNDPEKVHLKGASLTVPAQTSSGKNMGEDDQSLAKEKTTNEAKEEKTLKQEQEHRNDSVMNSPQTSSSIVGKDDKWENSTVSKVCNYARGKWVPDNNRPLYSGFGCKQWLSTMWACRLMQRTDFEYERLRWQPKDCQMEEFEGSKFLRRMQNKTLAFVGDSLGRQQFQSLMCMISGGKDELHVEDVGREYGLTIADGSARPNGWAFRFSSTNTTILYYWSASLCDVEPIDINNPNTDYAMHLDRPPAFLRQYLHKFDVLVLNTGHHWNRGKLNANRWVMHVGGVPNTDRKIAVIWGAKNLTIHSIVSWVNSQLPKYPGLKAFLRTISPRHFFGGEWNTGGSCDNTKPMSVGKEILEEESSDQGAAHAVKGTGVKLLDITALSQLRDEAHISRFSITAKPGVQDCLHWCLPGVPDTWNEVLFAQI
ncbi:protein trichome birefringence-like 16 [Vigna umbellata]|uniref:protein trichome birefringence-like 16 n=2 Tax=Vigna umbellata TaxID=87088 RepID=UPI001F5EE869|nr:protein trichome birefringence-like 16 [Vigna umbellata]